MNLAEEQMRGERNEVGFGRYRSLHRVGNMPNKISNYNSIENRYHMPNDVLS